MTTPIDSFDELQEEAKPETPTQEVSDFTYNNDANKWVAVATGVLVSQSLVTNQMRLHTAGTFGTLDSLTNQLYDGRITVAQWQVSVASELKDAHLAQAMYGAGGRANMTSVNFGRVTNTLNSEYGFLNGFAHDITDGNQSRAQALARVRQYGRASQQSYWLEHTQALGRQGKLMDWTLHPADHCQAKGGALGCVELADGSPYTIENLPTVPGGGDTTCRGGCNCTLDEV